MKLYHLSLLRSSHHLLPFTQYWATAAKTKPGVQHIVMTYGMTFEEMCQTYCPAKLLLANCAKHVFVCFFNVNMCLPPSQRR